MRIGGLASGMNIDDSNKTFGELLDEMPELRWGKRELQL